MTMIQVGYRSKVRKDKSKEAISLAMKNRWEDAVTANRSIIELFPDDVESYNRLGKALLELGQYYEARLAFTGTLQLSPSNIIAQKNLNRLSLLAKEQQFPKKARKLPPQYFLEESGKTGFATLEASPGKEALAKVTPGDAVTLSVVERKLVVESADGEYLGQISARLAMRLIRLVQGGNLYEAAITRLSGDRVTIIIREVFQHLDQRGINSFPSHAAQSRPFPPGVLLDGDVYDYGDKQIELAFNSEWEESGEANYPLAGEAITQVLIAEENDDSRAPWLDHDPDSSLD